MALCSRDAYWQYNQKRRDFLDEVEQGEQIQWWAFLIWWIKCAEDIEAVEEEWIHLEAEVEADHQEEEVDIQPHNNLVQSALPRQQHPNKSMRTLIEFIIDRSEPYNLQK